MVAEPSFWQRLLNQAPGLINDMGQQFGNPELSPYVQMAGQAMNPIIARPNLQLRNPADFSGNINQGMGSNQRMKTKNPTGRKQSFDSNMKTGGLWKTYNGLFNNSNSKIGNPGVMY